MVLGLTCSQWLGITLLAFVVYMIGGLIFWNARKSESRWEILGGILCIVSSAVAVISCYIGAVMWIVSVVE